MDVGCIVEKPGCVSELGMDELFVGTGVIVADVDTVGTAGLVATCTELEDGDKSQG